MDSTITFMRGSNFFFRKNRKFRESVRSWNVVSADVHQRKVNTTRTTGAIHLPRARKESVVFDSNTTWSVYGSYLFHTPEKRHDTEVVIGRLRRNRRTKILRRLFHPRGHLTEEDPLDEKLTWDSMGLKFMVTDFD